MTQSSVVTPIIAFLWGDVYNAEGVTQGAILIGLFMEALTLFMEARAF